MSAKPRTPASSGGIGAFLRRNSDLPLVGGVLLILMLLVFPVSPGAMDYFLATNIAISITILLIALYIPSALRLPSFPTILLLATLFRLALNVGTTRLILLEANAGTIIDTFGKIVVGGNFVVGAVVFLVLVIVQFIVIAKGSERVAEVAARFTLDAMPGKQMSIDADLRAGLIDAAGARRRRQDLERESKLYGAMDGAMKFVKGDAIAGIIISIVNVVGGLIIGVVQLGMSAGEAAEVYSLLTIGDGLVSQIPALLISVSAGIVVTRVAASDGPSGGNLATEMFEQVLENSKGLFIAGGLLLMAAVGSVASGIGFQPIPFVAMGGLLIGLGFVGRSTHASGSRGGTEAARGPAGTAADAAARVATRNYAPAPLLLRVHPTLASLIPGTGEDRVRHLAQLKEGRERRSRDLGVEFPPVVIQIDAAGLSPFEYVIVAHDIPLARGRAPLKQKFAIAPPKLLEENGIQSVPYVFPGTRITVALVEASAAAAIEAHEKLKGRVPVRGAEEVVFEHVDRVCRRSAAVFFGIQDAGDLLEALERRSDALVKAVVPKFLSLAELTQVLRLLLEEEVPIRDLARILGSLARWAEQERSPQRLAELVRRDLGAALSHLYAAGAAKLRFYGLAPDVEDLFQEGPLSPTERQAFVRLAGTAIRPEAHAVAPPVVIVNNPDIRRTVWWTLKDHIPEVRVMSRDATAGHATEAINYLTMVGAPVFSAS